MTRTARAVVLTGAGQAFSAGGNVDGFAALASDLELRRSTLRLGRQLFEDLINVHLPVIAAVNGPAVGLGCTIATACDVVIMSETAFLADPHVLVALVAGDGGAVTWPLNIGLLRAKPYLLTGDRMPAEVAVSLGLATRAVPARDVLPEAIAMAQRIAALPPQAVQDTKAVLNQHLRQAAVTMLPLRPGRREPVTRHRGIPRHAGEIPVTEGIGPWTSRWTTTRPRCRPSSGTS